MLTTSTMSDSKEKPMARERLPLHLSGVKHLRYTLERLTNQDRGITVEGMDDRRVVNWYVDEAKNLVVLRLEEPAGHIPATEA